MSKISIKTDFQDGDKLFAADLNNNFRVIQAGINANDQQLEAIIEDAIVRLDAELQAILDEQIWEWNGGDPVTFYKGTTEDLDDVAIKNGQLLYNTETGETALDSGNERITTGSGNVVAIGNVEPTNPATKIWINPDEAISSLGTEVVDTMSGNETHRAPSVHAVKEYVEEEYSTSEVKTNKVWIDGKPVYRRVFYFPTMPTQQEVEKVQSMSPNVDKVINLMGWYYDTTGWAYPMSDNIEGIVLAVSRSQATINNFSQPDISSYAGAYVVTEYTKTTDQGGE